MRVFRAPPPFLLATLLLCLPALLTDAAAAPGANVPDVPSGSLPTAGTGAPIPRNDVTWVTVGKRGWYRVDADPQDVEEETLSGILKSRSERAAAGGTSHDVWIVAAGGQAWMQVVPVLHACQRWGLHRVGLQVQSESGEGLMGFPLFLPYQRASAPSASTPTGTARKLEIRLEATGDAPSYPPRLYAAARSAVQRFSPVVAEVSISPRSNVQDAVSALDMLYRAGCAAVKLKYRMMVRSMSAQSIPQIWVEDRLLPSEPIEVALPPIRTRKAPWPDDGASQAGAHRLILEAIADPTAPVRPDDVLRRPLPTYAATGREVPAEALRQATSAVTRWSTTLGKWLTAVLRPGRVNFPTTLLVPRRRQGMGAEELFREARAAFPSGEQVTPATLRTQVFLFQGAEVVGKADLTLGVSAGGLSVVFGGWVVEETPAGLVLPPVETDPFAAGVPGELRVWIEGLLAAMRARGSGSVPLAGQAAVLSQLPPQAAPGVRRALADRAARLENLAAWLRARPYDRVFVAAVDGQAAVRSGGRVVGVLRYGLEPAAAELAISSLTAKRASR